MRALPLGGSGAAADDSAGTGTATSSHEPGALASQGEPLPLTWLADALRDAGLVVHETSGWTTRLGPGVFEPGGVLLHHTAVLATPSDPHPSLDLVVAGDADRLGPLCHVLVDRNGECWVVAAGRASHAGRADTSGPMPEGDGDAVYVGVEVEYAATTQDPTQYATSVQKSTAIVAAATIVARLGRDQRHVRAHRETSPAAAIDPYNWDMVSIRDSVRQALERTG
ncbi:N-acetylmuramoyl-L-alanine amidase [Terrabacter sp. Soil810]|uniref:peptidoglycan recognition protein family protein n=1 Tax=Terrabacter sp. Soil810 TaxID=1736418 RepID=UPI00070896D6|nr:N-acetylmuramoyl-L-alanine amidase [Terrabacter sp. Soil810]KRF46823.1 hypothetical protein ASG96_02005 [Terrabacter sp. Soil810]